MDEPLPVRCQDCLVRDTALCASLCDAELVALSRIGRRKTIPAGGVVTWAGDDNALCANIVTGALKVQAATAEGREQTVGLLFAGDFVGNPFTETSALTTEALTETDLCIFSRVAFERVLDKRPRLERALLERTMRSLEEARQRQLTLGRKSAKGKIAGFLLDIAEAQGGSEIELPIARGEMADYLGLTIETVSRQMTEMREEGLIDAPRGSRRVTLLDRETLRALDE
ncbi:Crp/Fnr family transcriptional regulator [Sphingomicrobium nitratireducens]|uniref:Crp/Fnr family transcriptional regulator n=1 Tax=Sphingomicrobium nitratireducens TaxID=2964666 RepID=UPI00223EC485|nr:helix-turn-helix domain-containing protein [Sphingomicrobium nitratireducens]